MAGLDFRTALRISMVVHLAAIIFVALAGLAMKTGVLFWVGSAIFSGLIVYQHVIVKHNDLSRVNLAFGTTNGVASILFATFVILSLWIQV